MMLGEELRLLLEQVDERLLAQDAEALAATIEAEPPFGPALWPRSLRSNIDENLTRDPMRLHWELESHYGRRMRSVAEPTLRERYELIGYCRVIEVLLTYERDMGFDDESRGFVDIALSKHATEGAKLAPLSAIEVGCGTGHLLAALSSDELELCGIDSNPVSIRESRRRVSNLPGAPTVHRFSLASFLATKPGRFDAVICCDVLEHIDPAHASDFCRDLNELLVVGGVLVLITPNRLGGPHDVTRHFKPAGSEPEGFHLREYGLGELHELLSETGFGRGEALLTRPTAREPDALSSSNLLRKIAIERDLELIQPPDRRKVLDDMYFKGVTYRKLTAEPRGVAGCRRGALASTTTTPMT